MPVLTPADTYEHDTLIVHFTCPCGKEHDADFSSGDTDEDEAHREREHYDCPDCGRRHYPIVMLVTHRAPKEPS
jgi:hypothetical protein